MRALSWSHPRAALAALVLALTLPSGARAQEPGIPPNGRPRPATAPLPLQPGDQIRLIVWDNAALSGDFSIAHDGTILHPLLGDIVALGVPMADLRARIGARLAEVDVKTPRFVMEPLLRVAVGGQVRTPGLYVMPAEATIMDVVLRGGGVTEQGRLSRVLLVRGGREEELDLTRADQRASQRTIQSGDQVLVTERRSVMRDYVVPISSVVGALGWIVTLIVNRDE